MTVPVSYLVVPPTSKEMWAWLRCNDIEPRDVPFKTDVFVESGVDGAWVVRHAVHARTAEGLPRRSDVYDWRLVPLQNDPPMWWLKDVSVPLVEAADAVLPGFNVD